MPHKEQLKKPGGLTGVHLRRWGIDAGHAPPQSTVKETKYSLNCKTQLINVQPKANDW